MMQSNNDKFSKTLIYCIFFGFVGSIILMVIVTGNCIFKFYEYNKYYNIVDRNKTYLVYNKFDSICFAVAPLTNINNKNAYIKYYDSLFEGHKPLINFNSEYVFNGQNFYIEKNDRNRDLITVYSFFEPCYTFRKHIVYSKFLYRKDTVNVRIINEVFNKIDSNRAANLDNCNCEFVNKILKKKW